MLAFLSCELGDVMKTHLRLDRGVYGGVGFSRDLSLRERDGMK